MLLGVHIKDISLILALFKDYKKIIIQKKIGSINLSSLPQRGGGQIFSNSLHLPLSSFPFALISTQVQFQFSAFLLDLHLIHSLMSILFPFAFVPGKSYLHLCQIN